MHHQDHRDGMVPRKQDSRAEPRVFSFYRHPTLYHTIHLSLAWTGLTGLKHHRWGSIHDPIVISPAIRRDILRVSSDVDVSALFNMGKHDSMPSCAVCMDPLFNQLDDLDEEIPVVITECGA